MASALEDKPGQKPYGQRSSERRRQQNREAQRLLRERRAQHDAEVSAKLQSQAAQIEHLQTLAHQLRCENARLKGEPDPPRPTPPLPSSSDPLPSVLARAPSSGHLRTDSLSSSSDGSVPSVMRSIGFAELPSTRSPSLPTSLVLTHPDGFTSPAVHASSVGHMPPCMPPLPSHLASPLPSPTTTIPPRMTTSLGFSFHPSSAATSSLSTTPPLTPTTACSFGTTFGDLGHHPNGINYLANAVAHSLAGPGPGPGGIVLNHVSTSPHLVPTDAFAQTGVTASSTVDDGSSTSGSDGSTPADYLHHQHHHHPSGFHLSSSCPATTTDLTASSSSISAHVSGLRHHPGVGSFTISPTASTGEGNPLDHALTPEERLSMDLAISAAAEMPMTSGGGVWPAAAHGAFSWATEPESGLVN